MDIDGKDILIAGLGVGGILWMHSRAEAERGARIKAEQRATALEGARAVKPPAPVAPANGAASSTPAAMRFAPRTFDGVFGNHGNGIPVPYLRALAMHESGMNARSSRGPAWGLMQVIEVVRKDFNQRHHAVYSRKDLLDPAINVTIASSALALIVESYARNHPRVANLQPNWSNPRFVELVTFGWNAGWSERGGVGRVSRYLEQRGVHDQTIDTIHQAARAAGASEHLTNVAKVRWSKAVVRQYLHELTTEPPEIEMPVDYVGVDPQGEESSLIDDRAVGPVTSPSQLETASGLTLAPFPVAPKTAHAPSGGDGLIDPYPDSSRPCAKEDRHA